MKILLLVQRDEAMTGDACWVIDAMDEYAMDEWNEAMPPPMQKQIDEGDGNVRPLWITVPDGSLEKAFAVATVPAKVTEPQP